MDAPERSDADLLAAVRTGDEAAYAQLWLRHSDAARRLASSLTRPHEVDDLVSESYYRLLRAIKQGGGPDEAFRPYLFSTMRRLAIDAARGYQRRVTPTGEPADLELEPVASAAEVAALSAEHRAAWQAWASLPTPTRTLLWHVVVEEQTPTQVAPILGISPNGVASRTGRAKERLRQAFLQQHLAAADREQCRETRRRFGAYVRNALSARDKALVEKHLAECEGCRAALLDITDVNHSLKGLVLPLVVGGSVVASKYLSAKATAAAAPHGLAALFGRPSRTRTVTIAAGTIAAAGVVALLVALLPGSSRHGPNQAAPGAATATTQGAATAAGTAATAPSGSTLRPAAPPAATGSAASAARRSSSTSPAGPLAGAPNSASQVAPLGGPVGGRAPGATTNAPPAATSQPAPVPPPPPGPAPPVVVTESVVVTVPDPASLVKLTAPAGWAIQAVTAGGTAVGGCSGFGTQTVSCLNVGVGNRLSVTVRGVRTGHDVLRVMITAVIGGGTTDYPL